MNTLQKLSKFKIIFLAVALIIFLAVAVCLLFGFGETSYRSVKIVETGGSVTIERDDVGKIDAGTNMNLVLGDKVITDKDSYAVLLLDTDKYVYLDSQGEVKVMAEGDETKGKIQIRLEKGTILNEIQNPLKKDSSYEIKTPNATMSVRGTVFEVRRNIDDKNIELLVYDGKVALGLGDKEETLYGKGEYTKFEDKENPDFIVEREAITDEVMNAHIKVRLDKILNQGRDIYTGDSELQNDTDDFDMASNADDNKNIIHDNDAENVSEVEKKNVDDNVSNNDFNTNAANNDRVLSDNRHIGSQSLGNERLNKNNVNNAVSNMAANQNQEANNVYKPNESLNRGSGDVSVSNGEVNQSLGNAQAATGEANQGLSDVLASNTADNSTINQSEQNTLSNQNNVSSVNNKSDNQDSENKNDNSSENSVVGQNISSVQTNSTTTTKRKSSSSSSKRHPSSESNSVVITEEKTETVEESRTEASTNDSSNTTSESTTEQTTNNTSSKPSESVTEETTSSISSKPTESVTEQTTSSISSKPTESETEETTNGISSKPSESVTEETTSSISSKPTESETEETTSSISSKPTESVTESSTEKLTEDTSSEPMVDPTESETEDTSSEPTVDPTESETESGTEESTEDTSNNGEDEGKKDAEINYLLIPVVSDNYLTSGQAILINDKMKYVCKANAEIGGTLDKPYIPFLLIDLMIISDSSLVGTNMELEGWYSEGSEKPWIFGVDTVKGETLMYAAWRNRMTEEIYYPVIFNEVRQNTPCRICVKAGTESLPTPEDKYGYTFKYWQTQDGEIWDGIVDGPEYLTPVWEENSENNN